MAERVDRSSASWAAIGELRPRPNVAALDTFSPVTDDKLCTAVIEHLTLNRTTGAGGRPLTISDANLVDTFSVSIEQLNRVLSPLMAGGLVHGKPASPLVTSGARPEWDFLRLAEDELP